MTKWCQFQTGRSPVSSARTLAAGAADTHKGQSKQTPQAVAPPLLLENVGAFIQNSKPSYKMTSSQNSKIAPRKKEQEEM